MSCQADVRYKKNLGLSLGLWPGFFKNVHKNLKGSHFTFKITLLNYFYRLYKKICFFIAVSNVLIWFCTCQCDFQDQKWPMFEIVSINYRAELDKTNMFFRKFSPSIPSGKKSKTHILELKKMVFLFCIFFSCLVIFDIIFFWSNQNSSMLLQLNWSLWAFSRDFPILPNSKSEIGSIIIIW